MTARISCGRSERDLLLLEVLEVLIGSTIALVIECVDLKRRFAHTDADVKKLFDLKQGDHANLKIENKNAALETGLLVVAEGRPKPTEARP